MSETRKIGDFHFVPTEVGTYAVRMEGGLNDTFERFLSFDPTSWDMDPVTVAGVRVVPWGADNNLPKNIRRILEKNNLAPGILDRKLGLIYGQGPMLYTLDVQENERVQNWVQDEEIQDWLDSWDYRGFIRHMLMEYNHLKGCFVKYHSGKAVRLGKPWIHSLECVPSADCRLVWPKNDSRNVDDIEDIMVGDFDAYTNPSYKLYPVFDKWHPARHEVAMKYHSMRSFGRNFYSISSFYGSVPWMADANALPEIIAYLNNNMIAAAYIVHVPQGYWQEKRNVIVDKHPDFTEAQITCMLDDVKETLARQIAEVMAGKNNAGKFFMCVDFIDLDGHEQSWKIEPIEMNIDKYIDALAKISRIADSSTTSGLGLNPALANIIIDGKRDSGSQMLYALKLFYGADTQIPEDIALEAINDAIRINFPQKKGVFIGLYRKVINKEDNVTAGERATNQV
jgi:hypothetical protein